jgi:thiamine kinase-like enzyme
MHGADQATAADEIAIRAALAAHARTKSLASAELQPLGGGLGNRTWRIEQGSSDVVVRLNSTDDAALGIDRRSEAALLAVAARAGIAPPLVLCDPERRLLVTEWVAGSSLSLSDMRDARNLRRLAAVLTRLHACPPDSAIGPRSFREQATHLASMLERAGVDTNRALEQESGRRFAAIDEARPMSTPCHVDVHHRNVIDDGRRLWLVDWEYGGLGNPGYDLAACISYHELTAAQRVILLDAYRGPADPAQLDDLVWTFDYVQWLWYRLAARNPGRGARDDLETRAAALSDRLIRRGRA